MRLQELSHLLTDADHLIPWQAVNFVLTCMSISEGGEVYVPKIPSYRIDCIAKAIAPDCEHPIIGRRPGEKIHEVRLCAFQQNLTNMTYTRLTEKIRLCNHALTTLMS